MDFFHFGPSRSLFGSFAPGSDTPGAVAVLCYPFGQEYMRAHRAFRQVATLLARRGIPVFRFDYRGTGDSAGEGLEVTLRGWVEDVGAAADEARRRSGAAAVRLAGLRLGATAAAVASQARDDVERLVLWDPVVWGSRFLAELEGQATRRVGTTWWVNGFPVPEPLREEVRPVDLAALHPPPSTSVVQIVSHEAEGFDALAAGLQDHPGGMETRLIPSPSDWNYTDDVGAILIPRELIRGIVDALGT